MALRDTYKCRLNSTGDLEAVLQTLASSKIHAVDFKLRSKLSNGEARDPTFTFKTADAISLENLVKALETNPKLNIVSGTLDLKQNYTGERCVRPWRQRARFESILCNVCCEAVMLGQFVQTCNDCNKVVCMSCKHYGTVSKHWGEKFVMFCPDCLKEREERGEY